jgi:hypothetical protein
MSFNPVFQPIEVTIEQYLAALRRYRGIRHSMLSSHIKEDFEAPEASPVGFLRCAGLLFAAWRWCGLLPREFNLDVTRKQSFAVLHANFIRVPDDEMQAGDLLFLDINGPEALEHVAVCTEAGRLIHALNDVRGVGIVYEQAIDAPVSSVYRMKNLLTGGDLNG